MMTVPGCENRVRHPQRRVPAVVYQRILYPRGGGVHPAGGAGVAMLPRWMAVCRECRDSMRRAARVACADLPSLTVDEVPVDAARARVRARQPSPRRVCC